MDFSKSKLWSDIQNFAKEQAEKEIAAAEEKERLQREREERRMQREAKKAEIKEPNKKITRSVVKMNDDGEVLEIFESLAEAVKQTGINSKSIRDCCNGIQKHAGVFVWKYLDE